MTKIRAGLYGLIVADALGVPAESRTRALLASVVEEIVIVTPSEPRSVYAYGSDSSSAGSVTSSSSVTI